MNRALVWLIIAGLLAGCAKKGRPGGGPEDKSGPFVERWSPVAGADSVPVDLPVQLTWSEALRRASFDENVLVSPDTALIEKMWDGRTLSVLPRGGWLPCVTHWVWITPGVVDGHGLPMEEPFGVWFSTADIVRPTLMEFQLQAAGTPASGATVTFSRDGSPLRWTGVANAAGTYAAPGLDLGTWRVAAFQDRDRDGIYDRGVEPWTTTSLELTSDSVQAPALALAPEDTAPPVVRDVRAEHSRRIRLQFSEPLKTAPATAFSLHDTSGTAYPIEIASLSAADPAGVRLVLGHHLRDDALVVTASAVTDSAGLTLADTMLTFLGTSVPDTVAPEVYRLLYDSSTMSRLWIMFTEPMAESGAESLRVFSVPGLTPVAGHAAWRDPQVLVWSAEGPLPADRGLLMVLTGARDLSGKSHRPATSMLPARADSAAPAWEAQALPP